MSPSGRRPGARAPGRPAGLPEADLRADVRGEVEKRLVIVCHVWPALSPIWDAPSSVWDLPWGHWVGFARYADDWLSRRLTQEGGTDDV